MALTGAGPGSVGSENGLLFLRESNLLLVLPLRGNLDCGHRWLWTRLDLE